MKPAGKHLIILILGLVIASSVNFTAQADQAGLLGTGSADPGISQ